MFVCDMCSFNNEMACRTRVTEGGGFVGVVAQRKCAVGLIGRAIGCGVVIVVVVVGEYCKII